MLNEPEKKDDAPPAAVTLEKLQNPDLHANRALFR